MFWCFLDFETKTEPHDYSWRKLPAVSVGLGWSSMEKLTTPFDSSTPIPFGRPLWISRIRSPDLFLDEENRESNFENLTPPMDSSTPIPFGGPLWISRIRSPDPSLMEKIENRILKIWRHQWIPRPRFPSVDPYEFQGFGPQTLPWWRKSRIEFWKSDTTNGFLDPDSLRWTLMNFKDSVPRPLWISRIRSGPQTLPWWRKSRIEFWKSDTTNGFLDPDSLRWTLMNFKDSVPRPFLDEENRESNFENLTPPMDSSTPIPFDGPLWISRIRSPDPSLMKKIENRILKIWHHHSILRYWFRIENFCGRLRNFFDSDVLLTSTNKPTHTHTHKLFFR